MMMCAGRELRVNTAISMVAHVNNIVVTGANGLRKEFDFLGIFVFCVWLIMALKTAQSAAGARGAPAQKPAEGFSSVQGCRCAGRRRGALKSPRHTQRAFAFIALQG
ncbi:hypothetical protein BG55_06180 [Erwinia mallotivora]|uniref:Uncharacterized protein n=1 Tax=Erwinia mallotivora TaxID=69222 RepID=A0A014ME26_9GAMM|nr:hypothetical protein BG55_06180 [Erwinia mallotivora]